MKCPLCQTAFDDSNEVVKHISCSSECSHWHGGWKERLKTFEDTYGKLPIHDWPPDRIDFLFNRITIMEIESDADFEFRLRDYRVRLAHSDQVASGGSVKLTTSSNDGLVVENSGFLANPEILTQPDLATSATEKCPGPGGHSQDAEKWTSPSSKRNDCLSEEIKASEGFVTSDVHVFPSEPGLKEELPRQGGPTVSIPETKVRNGNSGSGRRKSTMRFEPRSKRSLAEVQDMQPDAKSTPKSYKDALQARPERTAKVNARKGIRICLGVSDQREAKTKLNSKDKNVICSEPKTPAPTKKRLKANSHKAEKTLKTAIPLLATKDAGDHLKVTSSVVSKDISERLTAIPADNLKQVMTILKSSDDEVIFQEPFIIKGSDIKRLNDKKWINDNILDFYCINLHQRDESLCNDDTSRRPSYFLSSHFMNQLKRGYENVATWTRKFRTSVLDAEKIFIPVNHNNSHWFLIVVFIQKKLICYYDSLNNSNTQSKLLTPLIQSWITAVATEQRRDDISGDQFSVRESAENDAPQQRNSYDCGVFTMVNADLIAMDIPLGYTQTHINLFRKKITLDILNGNKKNKSPILVVEETTDPHTLESPKGLIARRIESSLDRARRLHWIQNNDFIILDQNSGDSFPPTSSESESDTSVDSPIEDRYEEFGKVSAFVSKLKNVPVFSDLYISQDNSFSARDAQLLKDPSPFLIRFNCSDLIAHRVYKDLYIKILTIGLYLAKNGDDKGHVITHGAASLVSHLIQFKRGSGFFSSNSLNKHIIPFITLPALYKVTNEAELSKAMNLVTDASAVGDNILFLMSLIMSHYDLPSTLPFKSGKDRSVLARLHHAEELISLGKLSKGLNAIEQATAQHLPAPDQTQTQKIFDSLFPQDVNEPDAISMATATQNAEQTPLYRELIKPVKIDEVKDLLNRSSRESSGGVDGSAFRHFRLILRDSPNQDFVLGLMAHYLSSLLCPQQIPDHLRSMLTSVRISLIPKKATSDATPDNDNEKEKEKEAEDTFLDEISYNANKKMNSTGKKALHRPLGICNSIARLLQRLILFRSQSLVAPILLPYQYAVGVSDGCNILAAIAQSYFDHGGVNINLDATNAFNLIHRNSIEANLIKYCPGLLPYFLLWYGTHNEAYHSSGFKLGSVKTGIVQGDCLSMMWYSFGIHGLMQELNSHISSTDPANCVLPSVATAYADDITLHMSPSVGVGMIPIFEICSSHGFMVNLDKTRVNGRDLPQSLPIETSMEVEMELGSDDSDSRNTSSALYDEPGENGMMTLGIPVGTDQAIANLLAEAETRAAQPLFTKHAAKGVNYFIGDSTWRLSKHCQWALLRYCIAPRLNHLFRALPPESTKQIADSFDEHLITFIRQAFSVNAENGPSDEIIKDILPSMGIRVFSNSKGFYREASYAAGYANLQNQLESMQKDLIGRARQNPSESAHTSFAKITDDVLQKKHPAVPLPGWELFRSERGQVGRHQLFHAAYGKEADPQLLEDRLEEGKMDQTLRAPKVQGVATIIALMSGRKLLLAFNESEQAGKANHRRALERAVAYQRSLLSVKASIWNYAGILNNRESTGFIMPDREFCEHIQRMLLVLPFTPTTGAVNPCTNCPAHGDIGINPFHGLTCPLTGYRRTQLGHDFIVKAIASLLRKLSNGSTVVVEPTIRSINADVNGAQNPMKMPSRQLRADIYYKDSHGTVHVLDIGITVPTTVHCMKRVGTTDDPRYNAGVAATLYKKKKIAKYRDYLHSEIQFMPVIFESTGLLESEAHKKLKLLVTQNNGGNLLSAVMSKIQWKVSWLYASFTAIARERLTLGVEEEDELLDESRDFFASPKQGDSNSDCYRDLSDPHLYDRDIDLQGDYPLSD